MDPVIVTAAEAGFTGAVKNGRNTGMYILANSTRTHPRDYIEKGEDCSFKLQNQLLWYHPPSEPPRLYYCNKEGKLFELLFVHDTGGDNWHDQIMAASNSQKFVDLLFDYIDAKVSNNDPEKIKSNIKTLISQANEKRSL